MTKLFLHIGPHKTGSTYIQKVLLANREHLLELGLNYPNIGIGPKYGHHKVFEKVKTLEQGELDEYMAHFSGEAVNLISSEKFDRLKLVNIERLSKSLSNVDVKIIYYHRNHIDLLPSSWQERVKHKSRKSFFEYILPHILRPFTSNIINPAIVLDLYANVFGKDKIAVVDYDTAVQKDGILRPIFEISGVKLEGIKNEVVNQSLKLELVEIIRALNMIAELKGQLRLYDVRAIFLRKRRADAISDEVEGLAAVIRAHFKPLKLAMGFFANAVNINFRKKYGSCYVNEWLEALPNREILVPSDSWMLDGDACAVCQRIYQYIMADDILEAEREPVIES
jgi:hypothetical protein